MIGHFSRSAVDEARANLRKLAAHLGVHLIGEQRAAIRRVTQLHACLAACETRRAASTAADQLVTGEWHKVSQRHLAFEGRADWPHLRPHRGDELMLAGALHRLATFYALLEHGRIIQSVPYLGTGRGDVAFTRLLQWGKLQRRDQQSCVALQGGQSTGIRFRR